MCRWTWTLSCNQSKTNYCPSRKPGSYKHTHMAVLHLVSSQYVLKIRSVSLLYIQDLTAHDHFWIRCHPTTSIGTRTGSLKIRVRSCEYSTIPTHEYIYLFSQFSASSWPFYPIYAIRACCLRNGGGRQSWFLYAFSHPSFNSIITYTVLFLPPLLLLLLLQHSALLSTRKSYLQEFDCQGISQVPAFSIRSCVSS